jgi:uncharacterized protein (DUF305 family)
MKKELLYGMSGLIVGAAVAGAIVWAMMDSEKPALEQSSDHEASAIEAKTGDEFDKAYLGSMISHHQMALDMAREAKTHAKHAELKTAAAQLSKAQSQEIEQMQAWQVAWGYTSAASEKPANTHMHH